ncbi:unannotated protein [freshwater metagenome]|uniref:Unannotated protein n=1 Tax=freshwater metagenome TaxID=449393 RepID=A0A6J7H113_9ZZZZ
MAGDEPAAPAEPADVPNVKKQLLEAAADRADTATDAVSPSGGNPVHGIASTLATAWISTPAAGDFTDELTAIGTSIRSAFEGAADHLRSLAAAQPAMVPHDDPRGRAGSTYGRGPNRFL